MTLNEVKYLDIKMDEFRKVVLRKVYDKEIIHDAVLGISDLDIYSKSDSFFSKLNQANRQSFINQNIILTSEQEKCLELLQKGNLFISAPTSFGKTFIALEYIKRNSSKIDDVVFVVPTIALMNELREKCFTYFGKSYTLITSDAELKQYYDTAKKIIIVVPERINTSLFQQYLNNKRIDLLIYDEIYKLNSENLVNKRNKRKSNEDSRLIKMNYIYKYLLSRTDKILLLGPFIRSVSFARSDIQIEKFITNLNLVYNEVEYTPELVNYLGNHEDKRFVYFKSPQSIKQFLEDNNRDLAYRSEDNEIIEWISENIHPKWYYVEYLKQGVGIHHGETPIFLRKYIENEFSRLDGCIHTILCTSTLIEGINTPTNQLVIADTPRNVFELNNLIGRVGRLNIENPIRGKVFITKKSTLDMYNPNDWIDLNIVFESSEISTTNIEDECLYLDKELTQEAKNSVDSLSNELNEKFNINYYEIIEAGIEFRILDRFIKCFYTITTHNKEFDVIRDLKYEILKENNYLRGVKLDKYSFYDSKNKERYLSFDPVYYLLTSGKGMKQVITKFTKIYKEHTSEDINLFIDTLFQIDKFIKFKMMKMIAIYELFDGKNLFSRDRNRAFIQSINMIKSYSDSEDGYERILTDLGFPKEDINLISNEIDNYNEIKGTEKKLLKLNRNGKVFNQLSPFGKNIINKIKDRV
ncbi:DEAD/DEAH box helicase [Listeria seeligeri]|uniref:DEAD/DEAH box helicase n=1 Tax=Listeria seeligeri TaxID=1640 RepID=UPI001624828F|nr:DEAD/DEAH box helicase [Listeria seeligeri]MBC1726561.1 DEAD/DEAH box helicase [Listeria seeligeri]